MIKIAGLVFFLFSAAGGLFLAPPVLAQTVCPGSGFGALCNTQVSIVKIVQQIVNVVLFLGFLLALVYLILAGIKQITASGDKTKTEEARKAIINGLIGLVVVLGSYVLVNVVLQFFNLGDVTKITIPIVNVSQLKGGPTPPPVGTCPGEAVVCAAAFPIPRGLGSVCNTKATAVCPEFFCHQACSAGVCDNFSGTCQCLPPSHACTSPSQCCSNICTAVGRCQ